MKYLIFGFYLLLSGCSFVLKGQKRDYVLHDVQDLKQFVRKDSLSATKFLDSLAENNYYLTKIVEVKNTINQTQIFFDKGQNYNEALVKIPDSIAKKMKLKSEFLTKNLKTLKEKILKTYTDEGFAFGRVRTQYLGEANAIPRVALSLEGGGKRKISSLVYRNYTKLPGAFTKRLAREVVGQVYNQKNMLRLQKSLQNHPFIALEKPPQSLFTKDSTNIYLFTQKRKSNSFDGIIGFGNDEKGKFSFNGSINVGLRNMFNRFESINLFWQRNPDKGQQFDLDLEIPYLFKTGLGLRLKTNIYRQDSLFAGVRLQPSLFYNFGNQLKTGLNFFIETSTHSENLTLDVTNFNRKSFGFWAEYVSPTEQALFRYNTRLYTEVGRIFTTYTDVNKEQTATQFQLFAEHNLPIFGSHFLNFQFEGKLNSSKTALALNELYRFGGWNNMRGFSENSFFADAYYYTKAEYRYVSSNQLFFDVFGQYGQLRNQKLNIKPKLYSIGLGMHFVLPIGLMSLQISNGSILGNDFRFSDTKIHWGVVSKF